MLYDCRTLADRDRGVAAAVEAVRRGDLVVLPTDTVYGIAADAFKSWSVTNLLNAKGQGRHMPPSVLVGSKHTLDGLVTRMPPAARDLADAFWTGTLTIIVEQAPTLQWDLGYTGCNVAVRMPLHPVALEVLRETGPLARRVGRGNLTQCQQLKRFTVRVWSRFGWLPGVSVYVTKLLGYDW